MDLELRGNNLYRNGSIILFDETDELILQRDNIDMSGAVTDAYHLVRKEDRLDLLAYNYYKNTVEDASKYWWVLADVNDIFNPLDLSEYVGKEILIPNILTVLLKLQ